MPFTSDESANDKASSKDVNVLDFLPNVTVHSVDFFSFFIAVTFLDDIETELNVPSSKLMFPRDPYN